MQLGLFEPIASGLHDETFLASQTFGTWVSLALVDSYVYLVLAGMLQGGICIAVALALLPRIYFKGGREYSRAVGAVIEMNSVLLLWG